MEQPPVAKTIVLSRELEALDQMPNNVESSSDRSSGSLRPIPVL